jgi:tetratricopeptide (TPR) repeat protein
VDPLVGTTVAHYDVEARLGGGGMGIVYAARDTKLGRRVALKFLPPQWSHDESAKQRFIREAQAASATDHPNICTIHDIGTAADGQLFIVMAHYDGETLKTRLERGSLPVDEAVDIAAQVAEGLAKAHSQGVVHRDIKPGNLILTEHGVKILDFGLAKFADARLKLTLEGSTIGTIAYMSPEQARGEEADARSDVWAVGVVLYEMLTGEVPFRGGYPEAIAHAIKHDAPAPIRATVPEVSEGLEQLVFRALHKDPAVRLQSARELARAVRSMQGRTLPLDLRTEALPPVDGARRREPALRARWRSRKVAGIAAAFAAVLVGAALWILAPVDRVRVVVAPVVNQTGYAELDAYRLALTRELVAQLGESRLIQVLPYERTLPVLRRFRAGGGDISSREALQALATQSDAQTIVIPTLLYENGSWQARVEVRDADSATNSGAIGVDGVVSSLMKDAVYGLMSSLTERIDRHFGDIAGWRAGLAAAILQMTGRAPTEAGPRLLNLDAAADFERGLNAYDQQEFAAALKFFTAAFDRDDRNALVAAWRSRAALVMRIDDQASQAADDAARLTTSRTARRDRLFIDAVVAEAQRDIDAAEERYRDLVAAFPAEPGWLIELGAFQDRTAVNAERTAEAINTYLAALKIDSRLARADLELCRLYGPVRQNERVNARTHGEQSVATSRAIGDATSEALALLCLTDVLRVGRDEERRAARNTAEAALKLFTDLRATYNLPRAEYAVGMAAAGAGNMPEAGTFFERSLASSRAGGNQVLEPLLLMNLGAVNVRQGNREAAAAYYRASSERYEALGDERRAAQQQANSAALRLEYGNEPGAALRDMENALGVFQKLGDKNFEAFCLQVIAAYQRQVGRHTEAERQANRAIAILQERNLEDDIGGITVDLARSRFDLGQYQAVVVLLTDLATKTPGPHAAAARLHLARARARVGDAAGAEAHLAAAAEEVDDRSELFPLLQLAQGEAAYEAGRLDAARAAFARGSSLWTGPLPDIASVEARANLGFLDAMNGRIAEGRRAIETSMAQAQTMERIGVEARCRIFLARLAIRQRQFPDALRTLDGVVQDDGERTIGAELRAQAQYWRGQALAGRGDAAGGRAAVEAARRLIDEMRATLTETERAGLAARPDIRPIIS